MNPVLTYEEVMNPHVTPDNPNAVLRDVIRQLARAPTGPPKKTYMTAAFIDNLFNAGFIPESFAKTSKEAVDKLVHKLP